MAKSDSFFIRAIADAADGGAFGQTEIDLGSFVNLGVAKSTLLRIHNIAVQYADGSVAGGSTPEGVINSFAAGGGKISYQLTTQTQTSSCDLTNKSLVTSGSLQLYGNPNSTSYAVAATESQDIGPQSWPNGYQAGVTKMVLV